MITYVCPKCRTTERFPRCAECGYLDSRVQCADEPYQECPQCDLPWRVAEEIPSCPGCGHVFTLSDNTAQIAYKERMSRRRDIYGESAPNWNRQ